ncbi:MAG: hypothetical protein K2M95_03490 [Clostridiales bacterium]|nr:hypothetical protein [Clostridiales bacterium]
MVRINAYNLLYDIRDFIRQNRIKLLLMLLVNVVAIIIGIKSGFSVSDVGDYLHGHRHTEFLFIIGRKSVFSYFFITLLVHVMLLALFTFSAVHFITAYLGLFLLFLRSYIFALNLSLYIAYLKLTVLPYVILCMIPFYLIVTCLFCALVAIAINRSCDARRYGCNFKSSYIILLQQSLVFGVMLGILLILQVFISYFLTLGIIL